MKIINTLLASMSLVALSTACLAQEEEDAPERYSYSSYYECSGDLSVADEAIAADAERLNGLVADGSIAGWGWLAHHTGGQWTRIFGHSANSLEGLLDGSDAIYPEDAEEAADDSDDSDDGPGFNSVCTRHDDYIWRVENGGSREARGAVGFGVYLICDNSKEERADEIVDEHVAPILNALVEEGALTSWGWLTHIVGGKYRRLQTMTAADHKSLLAARADAISAIYADGNEMGEELNDICYSHVDYIWDIVHEY